MTAREIAQRSILTSRGAGQLARDWIRLERSLGAEAADQMLEAFVQMVAAEPVHAGYAWGVLVALADPPPEAPSLDELREALP